MSNRYDNQDVPVHDGRTQNPAGPVNRVTRRRTANPVTTTTAPAAQPYMPDNSTIERMVAEAAYYLAEKRHFEAGYEEADWLTARQEVEAQLHSAANAFDRGAPNTRSLSNDRSPRVPRTPRTDQPRRARNRKSN